MGKTARTILVEFKQVQEQIRALEECASELDQIETQLQNLTAGLRGQWQGESADLYYLKCEDLGGKLSRGTKNLRETSDAIKQVAKRYYDAEMKAVELAKQRAY